MMKKVLILQASLDQSIAIAKFLKQYGDYYVVGSLKEKPIYFKSAKYFDLLVNGMPDLEGYDTIVPTGALSTSEILESNRRIEIGDISFSKSNLICFDKRAMLRLVKSIGLPVPITYESAHQISSFPVFFKQNFESGGGPRGIIRDPNYIELSQLESTVFYQEIINSDHTYGVGFLAKDGNILTYFMHREILSFPKEGGSGAILEGIENEVLLDYTKRILKCLNYTGWGLSEFKYCPKRNDFVFMEVNAKFWSSIEFAFINNCNFMSCLFGLKYDIKPTTKLCYIDRVMNSRKWFVLSHGHEILQSRIICNPGFLYNFLANHIPMKNKKRLTDLLKRSI